MKVPTSFRVILPLAVLVGTLNSAFGNHHLQTENWPQFRGPNGQSIAEGQTLPESFGPSDNVKWKTALPTGHSSPIVWGDRIFLTANEGTDLQMICLDRTNGEVLWTKSRSIKELQTYSHVDSSPSASTPCTDGERVAFLFGDYGVVVTDFEGHVVWEKQFLVSSSDFGYGASPALVDGKLLINGDGGIRSGLICFDFETGEEEWFAERPGNWISFSTPYVWRHGEVTEVLQAGSSMLSSYDFSNGEPIWHVTNMPGFTCPTPVANDDAAYFGAWTTMHASGSNLIRSIFPEEVELTDEQAEDPKAFYERFDLDKDNRLTREELPPSRARDAFGFADANRNDFWDFEEFSPLFAEKNQAGGRGRNVLVSVAAGGKGDVTESHIQWETRRALPYVASPLLYQGRLYYVKKGGYVSCVEPASGVPYFESKRLGISGEYYASPIGVDGKVVVASDSGIIAVLKASDEFEILFTVDMEESILASPAVADNHLYLRTEHHLWAFGE